MDDDLDLLQYLVSKIKVNDGCWLWQGALDKDGYGVIGTNTQFGLKYGKGKAHQLSYIAFVGTYPKQFFICHKCHVRNCISPFHLKLGTHSDNMKDRATAGQTFQGKGELNSRAKLTQKQVDWIRNNYNQYKVPHMAKQFNVTYSTIRAVIKNLTWKK